MSYTQEEIQKMRKRLPFMAIVYHGTNLEMKVNVHHIFNNGECATLDRTYATFIEIKEPQYKAFTIEDAKLFRDEWIRIHGRDYKITTIKDDECVLDSIPFSFQHLLACGATFTDTGKPFGKEVK